MTRGLPRLFLIGFFLTALLLLFGYPALAANPPTQITSGAVAQGRPDVHGDYIAWKRLSSTTSWDILMYDRASPGEKLVSNDPANPGAGMAGPQINPVTNGTYVIWEDWASGFGDIYFKNVSSFFGTVRPLVTGAGNQALLSVSGNTVVYVNNSNPVICPSGQPNCPGSGPFDVNNDIYAVDLTNPNNPYPVCTDAGSQWSPRISGTKVVWQDYRSGHFDIYMKDLGGSSPPQQVSTRANGSTAEDQYPDISGDIVVWQRTVNGVSSVWMKNTASSAPEAPVDSAAAQQWSPRISGDLITWMDSRALTPSTWNIYMKELPGGASGPLSSSPATQAWEAVDRDKVVWEEYAPTGIYSVWLEVVPDKTPPVISGVTPSDGSHTGCTSPRISANYTDNRMGVNPASVQLMVDGQDVTSSSSVTDKSVSYQPGSMADGLHNVTLSVADQSGNVASKSWQFYTSQPALGLSVRASYWASYSNYLNQMLTVTYQIADVSPYTAANNVEILAARASSGATSTTIMPLTIGNIAPGSSAGFDIAFQVQTGISTFRTTVYASSVDPCGSVHYLPGPPPA